MHPHLTDPATQKARQGGYLSEMLPIMIIKTGELSIYHLREHPLAFHLFLPKNLSLCESDGIRTAKR
jgi:hypothetical protein